MDSIVSGLGVGINTIIPNFSAKSIYNAFIKNDPNLLEPNIDIEIIKKDSDLDGLWNKGKGRVVYKFHTQDYVNADVTWGLNNIFQKDFDTITFNMYPIYLNLGFGYAF